MCIASILLIAAFSISTFSPECDQCSYEIYTLALTGVAYSLYAAAMWSCVSYIVKPSTLGTAFGILNSFQNIGVFVATITAAQVHDHTKDKVHGYFWPQAIFIGMNTISLIVTIALTVIDMRQYNGNIYQVKKGQSDPDTKIRARQDQLAVHSDELEGSS